MLSRFAPRALAAPVRLNAARFTPAVRTVTTDAASSHVEKSEVPEVWKMDKPIVIIQQSLMSLAGG
jgi:pyruvate dehydrogenase E1 component alpha subunit